jgi:restriction endonuclease S subunit
MPLICLDQVVEFNSGINPYRKNKNSLDIKADSSNFYTIDDFEKDYRDIQDIRFSRESCSHLQAGDIIYNLASNKAAIVSCVNEGKIFNHTFLKLRSNELENVYLLYLLNDDKNIKNQIMSSLEGSSKIKRITRKNLGLLEIENLDINEQRKISKIYLKMKELRNDMEEEIQIIEYLTNNKIREIIQDEGEIINERRK